MSEASRIHVITGGKYHDFDLARLRILEAAAGYEHIRASCAMDFSGLEILSQCQGLILYTCDLMPSDEQAAQIEKFVYEGGRIFALHAVNAHLEYTDGPVIEVGGVRIPGLVKPMSERIAPAFIELIGSRFVTHLVRQKMSIKVEDGDHPVTRGLADFEIEDEPYVMVPIGKIRTLMSARYKGPTPGYSTVEIHDDPPRPQLYVKDHGKGAVLYSPLGHACGKHDMAPLMVEAPVVRGPWDDQVFSDILSRGIGWAADLRWP